MRLVNTTIAISVFVVNVALLHSAPVVSPDWLWAKSGGGTGEDRGSSISVDAAGNAFVTGIFFATADFNGTVLSSIGNGDIFVAKYDKRGTLQWVRQAGGSSEDRGTGITVGPLGDVYVTGNFRGAVDFGGVFLTSAGDKDNFLAKYDTDGNLLWVRRDGGSSIESDPKISVDGNGNVYVSMAFHGTTVFDGTSITSSGSGDILVAKYDSSGNFLWALSAGSSSDDHPNGIAALPTGGFFVTGNFQGTADFQGFPLVSNGGFDSFTARYDSNGNLSWIQQVGGSANDFSEGIALDGVGNPAVAVNFTSSQISLGGTTFTNNGGFDMLAVSYDGVGNLQWAAHAGGSEWDMGLDIAADDVGNAYLTGYFIGTASFGNTSLTSDGAEDIFVAKFDESGTLLWVEQAFGSGSDQSDAVAVSDEDEVYLTGRFAGNAIFGAHEVNSAGARDMFVGRLGTAITCDLDWSTFLGGGSVDIGHGVAVNALGDVYATGETSGSGFPATFGPGYGGGSRDAFLSAYDASGNLLFSRFYGTGSNDVSSDIAIDAGANLLIAGVTGSSAFAAKFDAAGNELWTTLQNGSSQDSATGIDVAGNDDVYVVGSTSSTDFPITPTEFDTGEPTAFAYNGGDEDLFISKLDPAGSVLWSRYLGGSSQDGTAAAGITVDSAGDFYVGGVTFSADFPAIGGHDPSYNGGRDSFVVKLDATGHIIWGTFLGGSSSEAGSDLATDTDRNVYAGGRTSSSSDFPILDAYDPSYSGGASDAYISKFDENGSLVWSTYLGGSGEDSLQGMTAQSGSVIIATGYTRSPDFPVVGGTPKGPGSHRAVFVSHFDVDGNLLFSTVLDGSSEEEGIGISTDGSSGVVLTGFSTSSDFPLVNPHDATHNGQHDVIVARFQCEIPNDAPICEIAESDVVECSGDVTSILLDGSGSFDPDGDELTFAWSVDCPEASFDDPSSPTPNLIVESSGQCAIACSVTLLVSDDSDASSECSIGISVVDTTEPSLIVPAPITIECSSPSGVPVSDPRIQAWLSSVSASDSCNGVTITNDASEFFGSTCGVGNETIVTFTATDNCGNTVSLESSITVVDTTPPDIACNAQDIFPINAPRRGGDDDDKDGDRPKEPIVFTATASDPCASAIDIEIVDVQCQKPGGGGDDKDKDGKDNDKDKDDDGGGSRSPCRVEVDGDTLIIYKSGPVGTVISWSVIATDACGNVSTEECSITVVRPPRDRDDNDKDKDNDKDDDKD